MTTALPAIGDDPHNGGALDLPGPGFEARAIAPRNLTKKQKAAIIVRLLLAEGVRLSLADLPEPLQAELAEQMTTMRFVDRVTLKAVVDEFASEIEDVGLSFPTGLDGALTILDGAISPATAARLRKAKGITYTGDPWETISGLDPDRLLAILEEESVEIAAVLLSKLKVSVAADLISRLPGPRARRVAYAVSLTGSIAPEMVDRIGRSLAEQLDAQPAKAFDEGPVERVGAILNYTAGATRDDVLDGLDEEDSAFAEEVRKAIFTFANIPERLDARDVPKVAREIDQAALVKALAGAEQDHPKTVDFILGAMSKRLADQIREEMETHDRVKPAEAEAAMGAVVNAIRELEEAGEILLIAEDGG